MVRQSVCKVHQPEYLLTTTDEAILRYTKLHAESSPPKSISMKRLREWLRDPQFGNGFIASEGVLPESVWDVQKKFTDFIVPNLGSEAVEGLTFMLTATLTYLQSIMKRKRQPPDKLHSISISLGSQLNRAIVTTLASMFPVLPIIVLFFITRLLIRLGLVLLFTVLFAFVLVFGLGIDSDKTLAVTTA